MLALSTEKSEGPKGLLSNLLSLKAGAKGVATNKFSALLDTFSLGKKDTKDFLFTASKDGIKLGVLDKNSLKNSSLNDVFSAKAEKALLKEVNPEVITKKTALISLFKLSQEATSDEERINPDILKALPLKNYNNNIKALISEAKSYLKEQITQETDIKKLPKTLGGLIKLAQKSGIEVKAITLEELPKAKLPPVLSKILQKVNARDKILNISTSELVKVIPLTKQIQSEPKPLNILLTQKSKEVLSVKTKEQPFIAPKPILEALEEPALHTPKVLAATLQTLLHADEDKASEKSDGVIKLDVLKDNERPQSLTQVRSEALTQKISEAKQLVEHVSQNIKDSVENYKPPFTRIKMMLNPQKFGDMEVTLIQRGSNVHINISASSSALTVMMQNAHELKAQLSAQGLGDAQMNFSSQQQEQHQPKHKQEHGGLTYEEYQDFEDEFTEVATALEIVVPRYV